MWEQDTIVRDAAFKAQYQHSFLGRYARWRDTVVAVAAQDGGPVAAGARTVRMACHKVRKCAPCACLPTLRPNRHGLGKSI